MGKYAIYKYELSKGNSIQGDWTQGNEVVAPKMEHAYENFDHVFGKTGTEMRIQKVLKSGGGDTYPCHVMVHDRNIILLRLENVKKETIFEMRQTAGPIPSVEKKQIESYPPLHVLIDNRPGKAQMAIEIYTEAWNNTQTVCDLLQENLNRELKKWGLTIKIWAKLQKTDFWNYVTYREKHEHRGIERMTFNFRNAKLYPQINTSIVLSKHLKSLMDMINSLGAAQGELTLQSPTKDYLIKKKLSDIKNIVALCASSDYSLSVTFDDDVTYRCNQYIRAELPMNIAALEDFEKGQTSIENTIDQWLDWVVEQTENYQDAEQVKPKPNGKSKRKVS